MAIQSRTTNTRGDHVLMGKGLQRDGELAPRGVTVDASLEPERVAERRRQAAEQNRHIAGWGADLDRANRPAVPMERTPPRLEHRPALPLPQQAANVEVLHSTERPGLTPVFGTAAPPSGLSGRMRRAAYRYSENDMRHWLVLLAADRINMVEGIVDDLRHGHVPNVYREMGGPAELRYNRAGAMRKAAIAGAVLGAAYLIWRARHRRATLG